MGGLSIWHWIVVLVIVLLLFGRNKISDLMGDMAKGIKAFKKGMAEDETASTSDSKNGPAKTIDHQAPVHPSTTANPPPVRPDPEKKVG